MIRCDLSKWIHAVESLYYKICFVTNVGFCFVTAPTLVSAPLDFVCNPARVEKVVFLFKMQKYSVWMSPWDGELGSKYSERSGSPADGFHYDGVDFEPDEPVSLPHKWIGWLLIENECKSEKKHRTLAKNQKVLSVNGIEMRSKPITPNMVNVGPADRITEPDWPLKKILLCL